MGLMDNVKARIRNWLLGSADSPTTAEYKTRADAIVTRREYRLGAQKRSLRKSKDGYDDNTVANWLRLALDRSISLLFGKEVKFEYESEEVQTVIDDIWEANNKAILLHKLAMYGGEDGTVFVKIVPDAEKTFRIVPQDPLFKDVVTDPV